MSPAQLDANRANAQLSTGPRTEAGKLRSSQNATSHGFRSTSVVLAHEDHSEFDDTLAYYRQRFAANDRDLEHLIEQLVAAQWKLARVQRLQRLFVDSEIFGITENDTSEPNGDQLILNHMKERSDDVLVQLHRYEAQFDRLSWRIRHAIEKITERTQGYVGPQFEAMLSVMAPRGDARVNLKPAQSNPTLAPRPEPPSPAEPANPFTKTVEAMSDLSLEEMIADLKKIRRTNPTLKQAKDEYERELIAMGPSKRGHFLDACLAAQTKRKALAA